MTTRSQPPTWGEAASLEDLGETMAQFLEGRVSVAPTHGPLDPETAELVESLAAINRAGLITYSSQPTDPALSITAFVVGLCTETTAGRVCCNLTGTGLVAAVVGPPGYRKDLLVAGDRVWSLDGPADVAGILADASPRARTELEAAWQLLVIDPDPRTGWRLWEILPAALLAARTHPAPVHAEPPPARVVPRASGRRV